MQVIKGLGHVYLLHQENARKRLRYATFHPYRSMFGSLVRGFVTLWTFLLSAGLATGVVHMTIR